MYDVQTHYAWQEAMELARELVRICEEFSDGERNPLVYHLRNAVIDIPATIAVDLDHHRGATLEPVIRLATEIELVHRIYPAIDTGTIMTQIEALLQRMKTDRFTEREPQPEPENNEDGQELMGQPTGGTVVSSQPQVDPVSGPRSITVDQQNQSITSIAPNQSVSVSSPQET